MYKNVDDYVPKLQEMFPHIKPQVIKRIVSYGWRMFYLYNMRGCDTLFESTKYKLWFYCGDLMNNSLKFFNYYKRKLRRKIRELFKRNKREWDGYYYTGLTEEEYDNLCHLLRVHPGKKKEIFKFNNKICFKLADEAKLLYHYSKCIIKFKYIIDMGYVFREDNLKCRDVSIYLVREHPDTFNDVLISNYKYEQL